MVQQRKKKTTEFHFVDMNDPDRYKKLKVARACDFCRKRKSKCDIGIPGSGTCSNCRKANHVCNFSPVSSTATMSKKELQQQQRRPNPATLSSSDSSLNTLNSSSSGASSITSSGLSNNEKKDNLPFMYHVQNPYFSMDNRGHCGYEKHSGAVYNHMTLAHSVQELPPYTKGMEQELFDIYFTFVHPFYPILDRYYTSQALRYDADSLPNAFKWAVMAIALRFSQQHQNSENLSTAYHQHAALQLDHTPSLLSIQTLFLLYKFQELVTPVGAPLSTTAMNYLKEIQAMLHQAQLSNGSTKGGDQTVWTVHDEFVCRAGWIVYIIITMSSTADDRWKEVIEYCVTPSRLPSLTETEHYDRGELNTTCNLIHLIKISLLYSQIISLISDQSTLFVGGDHPEFAKFANRLDVWKSTLPSRIALSLSADPPILYSAQNQSIAGIPDDSSKSASFTSYLCLIYDILDLVISIHQSTASSSPTPYGPDISRKSTQVCYRAHSLTVGDVQNPHYSRLACIQGSRLIAFGLTLALQAQSYFYERKEERSLEDAKKYYSCCSLSFQIFDDMLLSPQLYMAVQTLRSQLDAKEQLKIVSDGQPNQQASSPFYSSSTSSAQSTPGIQIEERSQHNKDYTFVKPISEEHYFVSSNSSGHHLSQQQHPQSSSSTEEAHQSSSSWQLFNSSNYNTGWSHQFTRGAEPLSSQHIYTSYGHEEHCSMPMTPTFEDDFDLATPTLDSYHDPLTPPFVSSADSYFAPQPQANVAIASAGSFNSLNLILPIQSSKSCKNKPSN